MKQWKRLAALSSAIVMAAATLTYFPNDTLQNIRLEISASADETGAGTTTEPQVWIEDNLTWTLDADGTLTISGTGAMKNYDYDSNQSPVYNNSDVKKIVIEDGVTSIGDYAFRGCSSLTSITLPDSVTSIGDCAFVFCVGLSSITLPDSVTSIGDSAFKNCSSLTSITIPDSVTSIGDWTFYKCSSLTSITIPNSVTSIGDSAFYNCRSLTSITIPDRVTSIESSAFYNCSSLTSITIPKSVTSIGSGVFNNCNNLTVYLENGSTLTSNVLGVDESKIVSYSQWNEDNLTWKLYEDGTLNISGTGAMKNYIYGNNKSPARLNLSVTSIVIEEGVTSIGDYAFENCDNLTSITIPGNVESIGEDAFYNCDNLTDVTLQDGVKSIGDAAFIWCNNLTNIVLPNSITSIEGFAFKDCTSLTSITIPDGVTSIGEAVFYNCTSLTSITIPDSVTSIGNRAFLNCNSLTSITIPDSVTSIGNRAFDGCSSLKTISLSCKSSLKKSNFGEQANLVSYTNQHLLTKTAAKAATCSESGNKAYWTCEHCGKHFLSDDANPATATAVELSETVISASHKLTKVEAKDATCTESGNKEYWTCEHCKKYFLSDDTNPETAKAVEQSETILPALNHKNAIIQNASEPNGTKPGYSGDRYCPDCNTVLEKGYTYWIEDNLTWKLYEDGTLNISGTGAMKNYSYSNNKSPACSNLSVTSIVIEEGVTSIGDYAFENCDNLTSITIPENVEIIGKGAFYSCDNLKDVTLQDGVKIIERTAFIWCGNLTNIVLPNSITSIGDWAFKDCTSLTSIKIPSSVTSIDDPFYNCSSLKTISLDCGSSLKRTDFGKQADLVSYTPHTLIKTEAKPVTDDESGNKEYWTCSHCGKYFLSDDTNPETATAVELSEIIICNHKNAELRNASEPTETSPGYSGDLYCPDCDKVLEKGYTYWIEDNLTWKLYEDGTLNISGKGAMKDYIYGNNKSPARLNLSVTSIVIEEGVTSIGDYAFENCDNLTSITIPGNVESIGEDAFYNCDNLTDVTLQDGVKSIGRSAFIWCNNLTNIVLPNSVTSIGYFAFKDCTSLTSIKIPSSVTSMDSKAFYNCSSLETISLDCDSPLKRTDFGKQADLVSYTPHTLIKTEAKAATCTEDGNKAYWTCEHCGKYFLSDDTNPETATAVELSETVIPASHKLTKVEAKDATCTEDGNTEYWTCEHCGKYFLSDDTNPETATAVEQSETIIPALKHKNATTRDAVEPNGTKPGYSGDRYCPDCDTVLEKGYTYWNEGNLTWKLDADGTLNISGTGAMKDYDSDSNPSPIYNNSDVKEVVIEDGVTSIGNKAFDSCSSLTSITIPNSVTSIKAATFYGCTSLTSITIPDGVTSIGYATFTGCSSLTSITIPDSVTSIGYATFTGCSSLTSITIPDSVTSIGYATFAGCSSLTSITIPDSVTSIGESAFSNCSSLQTISLSCKSTLKRSDFGDQADLVSYALHTLKKTEAKAATYTENGNIEHWTCEHCGKYFLSDDSNPETAKAVELSETVIPALVQVATTTTPIKCVYGQDMNKIDLRDYVKNTDVVGEVTVKVATGSTLPDGMKLDGSKLSGKPAKAYEDGKEVTFTFTAENGNTANLTLLFLVAKADPTVEVAVSGDSHTEGDLVSELKLILSENSTKGVVEVVSEIKALVAGKNTLTWKFTPEDENNYHTVTGTVVVNAQTTTTTTTTKATTTTTKATTTTKPNKTTTTKVTTTTKPNKTTTTKATTTTKPSKTTATKVTTTTKPSKATTTKVTTTTTTTISSYGDVNLDGKVDIVDAIFLNKYLATLIQFSDAQVANADCCQDGVLNDQDTTALMQFIILLIDDLPVQPTEK